MPAFDPNDLPKLRGYLQELKRIQQTGHVTKYDNPVPPIVASICESDMHGTTWIELTSDEKDALQSEIDTLDAIVTAGTGNVAALLRVVGKVC